MRFHIAPTWRHLPNLVAISLFAAGCNVNVFSLQDDRELGAALHEEIMGDATTFPVLDRVGNEGIYGNVERIRDQILDSGEVGLADEFDWTVTVIHDDDVLNAFAAPGGYLYVYTGLIASLDSEDEFAGVMGHEIAHADLRHSTQQLTRMYGISTLFDLLIKGDTGRTVADIAASLAGLGFSREHETQADAFSVLYLCETSYAADGAAGFFESIEGSVGMPEFLSTHPNPSNRVEDIQIEAEMLGCDTAPNPDAQWVKVLATLP
jgi:beta-barrel assembly-enhancing protease